MSKEPLLFLCHRIPFPPNKGDKIRSFNILKALNQHFDVYLGCFIDDPYDERYVTELKNHCKELFYLNQNKLVSKLKGLSAFVTGKPITLPYYYDQRMAAWCQQKMQEHQFEQVFIYSSSMAQYCDNPLFSQAKRVIDFVDVDSDKWRQYAEKKAALAKYVFNREYRTLAKYEDDICQQFDASLFVSPDEAQLFKARQDKAHQSKVHGILNGVDTDYFDPSAAYAPEELVPQTPFISFTGAMDYWANIDAVLWFVEHAWPDVKRKQPALKLVVAGGNPSAEIQALKKQPDIIVTGRVNDMRPFIAESACVIAPLQIARGIQNKVLEAMALNKPVVSTTMAMEGINASASTLCQIADEPHAFAQAVVDCVNHAEQVCHNRNWILQHFTWQQTLTPLTELFDVECQQLQQGVKHASF
ncbi:TIGR03087 family PEP-CTERM/XrtA system glycosyltransferase [Colwellia sp. MEBiC06753]